MVAYFVTGILKNPPSALDEVLYERVKVFSSLGIQAKIVAVGYAPEWLEAAQTCGVAEGQVIAVFDRLQEVGNLPIQPLRLADYHELDDADRQARDGRLTYLKDGRRYATVDLGDGDEVRVVNFYDAADQVERSEIYDPRGFKSQVLRYTSKRLDEVDYLTPAGNIAIVQEFGEIVRTSVLARQQSYDSFDDFATAMLMAFVRSGDLVVAEQPEYQAIVAQLPVTIQRGYDLADAAMAVTPQPTDLVLTRQFRPNFPQAKVFDEGAADAQLQKGWRRLLTGLGILASQ